MNENNYLESIYTFIFFSYTQRQSMKKLPFNSFKNSQIILVKGRIVVY
ncbi:hypothetical protein FLWE109334_12745 [Flavobacterium weaverense]